MSNFHTTLSRRDFMKGIGLVGAGFGAAAAAAPVFHDMDEVMSSPTAISKRPWYVKLVDEPTVPIDYSLFQTMRPRPAYSIEKEPGYDHEGFQQKAIAKQNERWGGTWDKGPTTLGFAYSPTTPEYLGGMRDNALMAGQQTMLFGRFPPEVGAATGGKYSSLRDKPAGWRFAATVEERGTTKWQGTPEENLRTLRAAFRFYGADNVGAIPVDDKFLKLMWGENRRRTYEWGDVDDFVMTPSDINPSKIVIPRKCMWFVHWTHRQASERLAYDSGTVQGPSQAWGYSHIILHSAHMQDFIWALGYLALDNFGGAYIPTGYTGVASGAGEQPRWMHVMDPKFGLGNRGQFGFITDLPLAETSPIDFGGRKFCETCGLCAEACPAEAIPKGDPSWEPDGPWANPGYLGWRTNLQRCSHCPNCQQSCPFNVLDSSFIHDFVRTTVSTTSIFNSFFRSMDETFGYGPKPYEDWWARDEDRPQFGIDTTR